MQIKNKHILTAKSTAKITFIQDERFRECGTV